MMVISAYQVNNVLRVYGDQLRQQKISGKGKNSNVTAPDRINISSEAKKKAIIDRITAEVVEKITNYGPHDNVEKEVFKRLENDYGAHLAISEENPNGLVFKVLDEDGETVNSLSVEDSKFLMYKLKEITKETIRENML